MLITRRHDLFMCDYIYIYIRSKIHVFVYRDVVDYSFMNKRLFIVLHLTSEHCGRLIIKLLLTIIEHMKAGP